jgi:hypothetical protein
MREAAIALHHAIVEAEAAYFEAGDHLQQLQAQAFRTFGSEVLGLTDVADLPDPEAFGVADEHWEDESDTLPPELESLFDAEGEWYIAHGWEVGEALTRLVHGDPVREAEALIGGMA